MKKLTLGCVQKVVRIKMHPENWMGDMKDCIWNKKLNEIVIPGTHDSGTYCINKKSKFVSYTK